MRRLVFYGLMSFLALIVALVLGGAAWLTGTTNGTRWLLDTVSRHTPLRISAGNIEGSLLYHLRLQNVQIDLAEQHVKLDSFVFRWQPGLLFSREFSVKELILEGVRVQNNAPEKTAVTPDLSWPRVPWVAGFLSGNVERFKISRLTYRHLDGTPVELTTLDTSVTWNRLILSLPDLVVKSPAGELSGAMAAGFFRPSLRFDLAGKTSRTIAGFDGLSLQGHFTPSQQPEQLTGSFAVNFTAGKNERLKVTGKAGLTRQSINVRQLVLAESGRSGEIRGEGTITLTAGEPLIKMQLNASGVDLAPEVHAATDLSGMLALSGTPSRYSGTFRAVNTKGTWQKADITGIFEGTRAGMQISSFDGKLLGGTAQGNLEIGWQERVSLAGTIMARNIDPSVFAPDWNGLLNFDFGGSIVFPEQAPPEGTLEGRVLESRLHGRTLTGGIKASFHDGDIRVDELALQGKGFVIDAKGELNKHLALAASISDFSLLIPGMEGTLHAKGWIRRAEGGVTGGILGRGKSLSAFGIKIASADLTGSLGEGKEAPLHAVVALRKIAYDGLTVPSLDLKAEGTVPRHSIGATMQGKAVTMQVELAGGYREGEWKGRILRFFGRDSVGPWLLDAPAALTIRTGKVALSSLSISGKPGEHIELTGGFTNEPLDGLMQAKWEMLDIARVKPWLDKVPIAQIKGTSTGDVKLLIAGKDRSLFSGSARIQGSATLKRYGLKLRQMSLRIEGDERGAHGLAEFHLEGGGAGKVMYSSREPARLGIPEEGELHGEWRGVPLATFHPLLPPGFQLNGFLNGQLEGNFRSGKRIEVKGETSLANGKLRWNKGKDLFDATLEQAGISVTWKGKAGAGAAVSGGELALAAQAVASGLLTVDGHPVPLKKIALNLTGDEKGIEATTDLFLSEGGALKGRFSSSEPAGLALPAGGKAELECRDLNLTTFGFWLPDALGLEGRVTGRATGELLPEKRFTLKGKTTLAEGRILWMRPGGEVKANLRSAALNWDWRNDALSGDASLIFMEYGKAAGEFRLPIAARFPLSPRSQGPLQASLRGQFREQGVFSALFPGFIRESHGEIAADLSVAGTWSEPEMAGSLNLSKSGAYLPTAGIHVKDLGVTMHLEHDTVRIDSFRAASGPGTIEGEAFIGLRKGKVLSYRGRIGGGKFQVVYLPELQLLVTPQLTFEGTPEKLTLRGEIHLPSMLISGKPEQNVVLPSKDVILEGAQKKTVKGSRLALDVHVKVTLGDNVLAKLQGIDAKLGGSMDLSFHNLDKITSKGAINVIRGHYRAYGVNLEIVRGRLLYAGGPINEPALDILALRTIDDVRAGIIVGGSLREPVTKLYSSPPMPDVDILAYVIFGHPLGANGAQAGLMAQAAGALLSKGESVVLQEQIRNRLGLSTLEIRSAGGGAADHMGYQEIPTTAAGISTSSQTSDVNQTMLTVGKYLTPQLYFSYGRSLFTDSNLFRLRYDIFKRWQIETQTGTESSVDIYYKIEFD